MFSERSTRILLIGEYQPYTDALKSLLNHQPGLFVCGQVFEWNEVLSSIQTYSPDLVVMEANRNYSQGIRLGKTILEQYPSLKLILLTWSYRLWLLKKARQAGFQGYVSIGPNANSVLACVQTVLAGHRYFNVFTPDIFPVEPSGDEFTRRLTLNYLQIEIISLIRQGLSDLKIADRVLREPQTIRAQRHIIYRKLGISNNKELIQFAIRQDL